MSTSIESSAVESPPSRRSANRSELVSPSRASTTKTFDMRSIAHLVATAVAVLVFAGSGIANVVHAEHLVSDMSRLGYPLYFMTILGTWKLLGAIVVAAPGLPRAKEWAYAGMIFDLTGAAASRAAMSDGAPRVLVPLVIAAIVGMSWATRPASRRLATMEAT